MTSISNSNKTITGWVETGRAVMSFGKMVSQFAKGFFRKTPTPSTPWPVKRIRVSSISSSTSEAGPPSAMEQRLAMLKGEEVTCGARAKAPLNDVSDLERRLKDLQTTPLEELELRYLKLVLPIPPSEYKKPPSHPPSGAIAIPIEV